MCRVCDKDTGAAGFLCGVDLCERCSKVEPTAIVAASAKDIPKLSASQQAALNYLNARAEDGEDPNNVRQDLCPCGGVVEPGLPLCSACATAADDRLIAEQGDVARMVLASVEEVDDLVFI